MSGDRLGGRMAFKAGEVNRCNLGHLNSPGSTVCGWCGAPMPHRDPSVTRQTSAPSASPPDNTMIFVTSIWSAIFASFSSVLLLVAWFSSFVIFEQWSDNDGSVGFFGSEIGFVGSSFVDDNALSKLWPSGIKPGVFLVSLTIPVVVLTGLVIFQRQFTRRGLIALTSAIWGLAAAVWVIPFSVYDMFQDSVRDNRGAKFIEDLRTVALTPGHGLNAVFLASIFLAVSGLILLAGSRAE